MSLCAGAQEAVHMRQLKKDIGNEQVGPTASPLRGQSSRTPRPARASAARTRGCALQLYMRERVATSSSSTSTTEEQLADLLTKALAETRVQMLRQSSWAMVVCEASTQWGA